MSAPTLLTLPSEIRQLIWQNVFVNNTCSPKALPESKYYEDFCEVCQKEPPSALPIDTAIRPLLTCRQIYGEASPHFYASLTVIITNPTQAYALTTPQRRRLANRLKDLVIYNHLDLSCPHLQASALEKLFGQLPRLSLQRIVVHNHMHPPSSYDLLCPGIFYMSPLLAGQSTPYKEWRTKVDLNFAYRWDYLMFESPLLGEIRTNDALEEHEKVLRELLDDERFKRGVREGSDEAQTWALLRIARSHERTWLESLRRKRMESLSQEEIDAIEREMAVDMELGVADDEESSDSD